MKKVVLALLLCLLAAHVFAQPAEWSDWTACAGNTPVDYRWRFNGMCLINGCAKDLQFRNNTSKQLVFKYTAHVVRMGDDGSEDAEKGSATLNADGIGQILKLGIGTKVLRVRIEDQ